MLKEKMLQSATTMLPRKNGSEMAIMATIQQFLFDLIIKKERPVWAISVGRYNKTAVGDPGIPSASSG